MFRKVKRMRLQEPTSSAGDDEKDVFQKTKDEHANHILMESLPNEIIYCMGYVLASDQIQRWIDPGKLQLRILPYGSQNIQVQSPNLDTDATQKLYESSIARRVELQQLNDPTRPPHPVITKFTAAQEEITQLVRLCSEVVKIFDIKAYPEFSRRNGAICGKFLVENSTILSSELIAIHNKGYQKYEVHVLNGKLYITFQL